MRFAILLATLFLPFAVSATPANAGALKTFAHTGGFASCVDSDRKYAMAAGDRSTVIADADLEQVTVSVFTRHPMLAQAGILPEQFLFWRKAGGEELLLFLVTQAGGGKCVFASIAVESLSTAPYLREKYLK